MEVTDTKMKSSMIRMQEDYETTVTPPVSRDLRSGAGESSAERWDAVTVTRTTAPSLKNKNSKGSVQNATKCDIDKNRMCNTHNCGTRTIKVTTKKWVMNKKTGLFGNKNVKLQN